MLLLDTRVDASHSWAGRLGLDTLYLATLLGYSTWDTLLYWAQGLGWK